MRKSRSSAAWRARCCTCRKHVRTTVLQTLLMFAAAAGEDRVRGGDGGWEETEVNPLSLHIQVLRTYVSIPIRRFAHTASSCRHGFASHASSSLSISSQAHCICIACEHHAQCSPLLQSKTQFQASLFPVLPGPTRSFSQIGINCAE